jgi:hypothetical protein
MREQAVVLFVRVPQLKGQVPMATSLKDRVERLERQVRTLAKAFDGAPRQRDWRTTFGTSAGDEGFEEMIRLGREIRRKQRTKGGPDAHSRH